MAYDHPGMGYRISGEDLKRFKVSARKLRIPLDEYVSMRASGMLRCDGGRDKESHWSHKTEFKQNWSGRSRTCNECKKRKSVDSVEG